MCKWKELGTEPQTRFEPSLDFMKEVTVFICTFCNKTIRLDITDVPEHNYCERS